MDDIIKKEPMTGVEYIEVDYPNHNTIQQVNLEDLVAWLCEHRREMVRKAFLVGSSNQSLVPLVEAELPEPEIAKRLSGTSAFTPWDEIGIGGRG